jgi:predicted metalloprotease
MSKRNLYKVTFQNANGVFVSLVAAVNKELSENEALLLLTKEVASNYCEDNHYTYDNKIINDLLMRFRIRIFESRIASLSRCGSKARHYICDRRQRSCVPGGKRGAANHISIIHE